MTIGNINKLCYKLLLLSLFHDALVRAVVVQPVKLEPDLLGLSGEARRVGSSIQPGSSRAVSVKSLASKKLLLAQVAALPRLAPPQRLMFSRAVKAVEATRSLADLEKEPRWI